MRVSMFHILFLISTALIGQNMVTFKVIVPTKTDKVFITGNQESLGDWEADKIKMNVISDYEREITTSVTFPAEFKFTRGSWESEAVVVGRENGQNLNLVKELSQQVYVIDHWSDDKIGIEELSIKYNVHYLPSRFYPAEERIVKVCLPKNYDKQKKYPVIYALDGNSLFHLLVQNVAILQDQTYDDNNIIPECIAVGIFNTDRGRDLAPNTGSNPNIPIGQFKETTKMFYRSIISEIMPLIDSSYSTSGYDAIIGHSDAGHFVTRVYLEGDDPFEGVIALSVNDFGKHFQDELPDRFRENKSKSYFLGYGKKDDEFNLLGPYLETTGINNGRVKVKGYNADHVQLPVISLQDGLKFIFSKYRNYEELILEYYNDTFTYERFAKKYAQMIEDEYGVEDEIGYEIYYLLNVARDNRNLGVFNSLLDHIDSTNIYPLQVRFYATNEFDQDSRAKDYLYQMLDSDDELDKLIFFANLKSQYQQFFIDKLDRPDEFVEFVEMAMNKWPEYSLEFKYLMVKVGIEGQLDFPNKEEYLSYLENNFRENRYFTKSELKALNNK